MREDRRSGMGSGIGPGTGQGIGQGMEPGNGPGMEPGIDPGIDPDIGEICRYLGYRGALPGEDILREIRLCKAQLAEAVTPRSVWEYYDILTPPDTDKVIVPDADKVIVPGAGLEMESRALARNLAGCRRVCLMAATLGPGPDRLIARESVRQMSRAVILQAAAAAMIEAYCDLINGMIREEACAEGFLCRPRFSPGYGDLPLTAQIRIGEALQMNRRIGITLTGSLLMSPSKSVTALIGLAPRSGEEAAEVGCDAMESGCDVPESGCGATGAGFGATESGCEACSKRENCLYHR